MRWSCLLVPRSMGESQATGTTSTASFPILLGKLYVLGKPLVPQRQRREKPGTHCKLRQWTSPRFQGLFRVFCSPIPSRITPYTCLANTPINRDTGHSTVADLHLCRVLELPCGGGEAKLQLIPSLPCSSLPGHHLPSLTHTLSPRLGRGLHLFTPLAWRHCIPPSPFLNITHQLSCACYASRHCVKPQVALAVLFPDKPLH